VQSVDWEADAYSEPLQALPPVFVSKPQQNDLSAVEEEPVLVWLRLESEFKVGTFSEHKIWDRKQKTGHMARPMVPFRLTFRAVYQAETLPT